MMMSLGVAALTSNSVSRLTVSVSLVTAFSCKARSSSFTQRRAQIRPPPDPIETHENREPAERELECERR